MKISAGFAAALVAITAILFSTAALALNPQPEVPSKPSPEQSSQKKNNKIKMSEKSHRQLLRKLIKH
jgi:hypothetical protein